MSDQISRGEHNDVLRRIETTEARQEEMVTLLHSIDSRTQLIQRDIGTTAEEGLRGNIKKVNAWQTEHGPPDNLQQHIQETVATPKERKVSGWSIFAAVIGAVGVLGSLAVAVLK